MVSPHVDFIVWSERGSVSLPRVVPPRAGSIVHPERGPVDLHLVVPVLLFLLKRGPIAPPPPAVMPPRAGVVVPPQENPVALLSRCPMLVFLRKEGSLPPPLSCLMQMLLSLLEQGACVFSSRDTLVAVAPERRPIDPRPELSPRVDVIVLSGRRVIGLPLAVSPICCLDLILPPESESVECQSTHTQQ